MERRTRYDFSFTSVRTDPNPLDSEFHLVAGGEELFTESGLLAPVKIEDACDANILLALEDDDEAGSSTSSPQYSPLDLQSDIPLSPHLIHSPEYPPLSPISCLSSSSGSSSSTPSTPGYFSSPTTALPSNSGTSLWKQSPLRHKGYDVNSYPGGPHTGKQFSSSPFPTVPLAPGSYVPSPHTTRPPNRITSLTLFADGMTPFTVKVDNLATPASRVSAVALKLKLSISSIDDVQSPSTLHGFVGNICLAHVWNYHAKCDTKVYAAGACISHEITALQISSIELGTPIAQLPESSLSRCRWLDACQCSSSPFGPYLISVFPPCQLPKQRSRRKL